MGFIYGALAGSVLIVLFSLREKDRYQHIMVATLLSCFAVTLTLPQTLVAWLHPQTMDLQLFRADALLHLNAFKVCLWIQSYPHARDFLIVIYYALPFTVALAYAMEKNLTIVRAAMLAAFCAFPIYNLFPACGPMHAFDLSGAFFNPALHDPRNCMPSLHFSWALLVALNVRRTWLRVYCWTFFALTACATITTGEHYFVDLIAAVPFCMMVQAFATRRIALRRLPELVRNYVPTR